MASYRGKHSRPTPEDNSSEEHPAPNRQQAEKGTTADGSEPERSIISSLPPVQSEHPRRARQSSDLAGAKARAATPHAFKHHEAVHETGSRRRHSRSRTLLIVIPLVVVLLALAAAGFLALSTLFTPVEVEPGVAVTVTIPDGATTDEIAGILKQKNVISDTLSFTREVRNLGAEQSLKPGTYELSTLMDTTTLISLLASGPASDGYRLTVPEGLTVEQTAAAVQDACAIPAAEFLARTSAASEYVGEYPFLDGVYNNSLEGFLYPKTYTIPTGSNADYVVRVMLDQFALETAGLSLAYAGEHGMNLFHVVTMASLIEKETAVAAERPLISSVIYNRLRDGMRLQIDATVVYALGAAYGGRGVSYEDLEVDSPYNTYLVDELPAGPICSPSIESMEAAAHPEESDYYYYVLTSVEGFHTFCASSEEFEAAKAEYERIFGIE